MKDVLNQWVIKKLALHNWSMRELARRTGIDHGQISRVLANKQEAKLDFYLAAAEAFEAIPEMLHVAGLLPAITEEDQTTYSDLLETVKKLTPEDRQEVLLFAFFRLWKQQCQIKVP